MLWRGLYVHVPLKMLTWLSSIVDHDLGPTGANTDWKNNFGPLYRVPRIHNLCTLCIHHDYNNLRMLQILIPELIWTNFKLLNIWLTTSSKFERLTKIMMGNFLSFKSIQSGTLSQSYHQTTLSRNMYICIIMVMSSSTRIAQWNGTQVSGKKNLVSSRRRPPIPALEGRGFCST